MSTDRQQDLAPAPTTESRNEGRRRLIRGGMAAGPVILSLGSQPVFGTGLKCMAPSKTLSVASSQTTKHEGDCGQCLPISNWKSKCGNSSDEGFNYGKNAFHDIFFQGSGSSYAFTKIVNGVGVSKTVREVLDVGGLGAQFACAYLNIMTGRAKFPVGGQYTAAATLSHVRQMWIALAQGGLYEASAGVLWNSASVSSYLSNNKLGY